MKISGIEAVKQYIPQREPIIMIDSIVDVDENCGVTQFSIKADNLFVENGFFREAGIVEHIAQSAAANVGVRFRKKGENVPLGFIAAIKNLKINRLPLVGDCLQTKIEIVNQVLDVTIVQGTIFLNNEEIAHCEMRIFLEQTPSL